MQRDCRTARQPARSTSRSTLPTLGEAGDQTTNELAYTGYARVAVARTGGGWTVTNNIADNTAAITFGACTAGTPPPITHFGLGSALSGAGNLFLRGDLTTPLAVNPGITPEFAVGTLDVSVD